MRVVSLLPAATEIVCALGRVDQLVAVSHDCDYPAEIEGKPRVTRCEIHDSDLSSEQVDSWVRQKLAEQGTLYTIDEELLRRLEPDLILTQQLCDVCAPTYGSVAAMAATLPSRPRVVNLEPATLAEVLGNVRTVAKLLGVEEQGEELVGSLEGRIERVRERTKGVQAVRCLLLEWLEPIFCAGHWNPELVELAGGLDPIGQPGKHSRQIEWEQVRASQPEVLAIACCGYRVERTQEELHLLRSREGWFDLPAVEAGRTFVLDGSAYFSRPGPRLVDSLELLAGILHPERFPEWRPEEVPRELLAPLGPSIAPT